MEIDPKKINFDKIKPYQNLENKEENEIEENVNSSLMPQTNSEEDGQKGYDSSGGKFGEEKLMGVFELLSLSWKMFTERWKKFAGLVALSVVLGIGIDIVNFILRSVGDNSFLFVILGILIILVSYILQILIGIALIKIMRNKELEIFEAVKSAVERLVPFFLTMFIGFLTMIGVLATAMIAGIIGFLILSIALFLGIMLFNSNGIPEVFASAVTVMTWLLGFIAILLLFLLIVIILTWISFASFAVVLERMSPMESLCYSYWLMKRKIFSVAWRLIAVYLMLAAGLGVVLGTMFISLIIFPFFVIVIVIILLLVMVFVVSPLLSLFEYNIYENLKIVKERLPQEKEAAEFQSKIKIFAVLGALMIVSAVLLIIASHIMWKSLVSPGVSPGSPIHAWPNLI